MSAGRLSARLKEFETWHTHARNRACHDLGIPLVTLAALGALARVPLGLTLVWVGTLDLGLVLLVLTFLFDLWLQWRLAPAVLLVGTALWWVGSQLPAAGLVGAFVLGWFFQLLGHRVFEGNRPAFTDNLVHLAVGPRWLVNRWFRILPKVTLEDSSS